MNTNQKIIGVLLLLPVCLYFGIRYYKLHEFTRFSDNIARYEAVNVEILSRLHDVSGSITDAYRQEGFNNDTSAHATQLIRELFRDNLVDRSSQLGFIGTNKDSMISYTVKVFYSHWLKDIEHKMVYDPHNNILKEETYYWREIKPNWKYVIYQFNWPYN